MRSYYEGASSGSNAKECRNKGAGAENIKYAGKLGIYFYFFFGRAVVINRTHFLAGSVCLYKKKKRMERFYLVFSPTTKVRRPEAFR